MIYINDVLKRCKEKGYEITRSGIYVAGKREGFFYKNESGGYKLDKDKFEEWLKKAVESIPQGYLSARQIIEKYGVSQSEAYFILHDSDCEVKEVGSYGVFYGEQKSVERVIEKRGKKHKYEWDEENGK